MVTKQPKYVEAHYSLLASNHHAVCFKGVAHQRYPVTIVCDEQPISQTTFIFEKNSRHFLLGLDRPLTMGSVVELGGIDKVMEMISKGTLKYVSAVMEVRVVDVVGIHCSNPMTVYLTDKCKSDQFFQYVEEAVKMVNTCRPCQLSGTECIFSANKKGACIRCSTKNVICEGLAAQALVCDMSNDHIAAEAKIDELIPVVYGIYHVAKALTNYIRNNTALLEDSYFSIQTLLSLYSKSMDTGSSIGTLPRTVFISTDRQKDDNSYMLCGKEVRQTLSLQKRTTFQRYPDIHQGPKSYFQKPVGNVKQLFQNKNGEIFWVEENGVYAISHRVFCQKKQIEFEEEFREGLYGIISKKRIINRRNGDVKEEVTEHLYVLHRNTLSLYSHLQKSQEGTKPATLRVLHNLLFYESNCPVEAKFCSSGLDTLVLADFKPGHVFVYVVNSQNLWPCIKKKKVNQVENENKVDLELLCSMLLEIEDSLVDCTIKSCGDDRFQILCLSNRRITVFDSNGLVIKDIRTTNDNLFILPFGHDLNTFATVNKCNKVLVHNTSHGKVIYSFLIQEVDHIMCVTSYGESVIISGTNQSDDHDNAIFISTSLLPGLQFCRAIEDLYNSVGFSSSLKSCVPKHSLLTTFGNSSSLSNGAMGVFEKFKGDRKSLFSNSLQSGAAIGFIHEPTLRCMLKTVQYMQNAEHLLSDAKNSANAKIECMVNELYIEGFFGNITQSLTGDSADLHDYVYRKRKIEISSIIKNCSKSFVFRHNTNKMYAAVRQCEIDAWEAIAIFKTAQCQSVGDDPEEPISTEATKKCMTELYSRTKGQRCRASRSNHKKIAMTAPYEVFDHKHKAKKQKIQ